MHLMILAAGHGTRLRPLTYVRPKALCPVWGKPLLERWIRQAAEEGFRRVVVNAHHMSHKILDYFASHSWPIPVQVLVERDILGTGGGVRNALEMLDDAPLVVVNADVAAKVSLQSLVEKHRTQGAPATMLLCRSHRFDTVRVNAEGTMVTGFSPSTMAGQSGLWTFSGIHVVEPSALRSMDPGKPYHIIDLYEDWIARGTPPAAVCREHLWWTDMGSLESYWNLHTAYDRLPNDGACFLGISDSGVWVHPSATVASSARLRGAVVVGEASIVERGCVLDHVILWKGCRIEPETVLENCVVADGAVVSGRHRNTIFLPSAAPVPLGQTLDTPSPIRHSVGHFMGPG
ncbi:sugar phosphate nucleotidyltransferase [Desulfosoma caldarium]|uniref:Mannose-1-phosphate guanylyltransferase n=1 Tax=Desulfosoma caldarium TaxID=610254 RepID=A0A3N1VP09_9BACT|nr:NDP-sugar synthase [Desulfosoma caldarium]ROR01647.1 mannose-1-phosphate guanylyltransferase [Desulfosoma caldarium]